MAGAHYINADGESNGVSEVINVTGYRYDATFFDEPCRCATATPQTGCAKVQPCPETCARSQRRWTASTTCGGQRDL